MANTESTFSCDGAERRGDNECKNAAGNSLLCNANGRSSKDGAKTIGNNNNVIAKSHNTSPGEIMQDGEVHSTGTSSKGGVNDLPVIQVDLSENENKSPSTQRSARELQLEETSLLDGVGDFDKTCNSGRNSLPEPFMMSVSPTASIFNYLSSVPSPLDKAHDDSLLMEPSMSPNLPTVESIIDGQSSSQDKPYLVSAGKGKASLDNFKSIDVFISSSYLPELPDLTTARNARNALGKEKMPRLVKPSPYPSQSPRKQREDESHDSVNSLQIQGNKSVSSNNLCNDLDQNPYASCAENLPSCRFEISKGQSLQDKDKSPVTIGRSQSKGRSSIDTNIPKIKSPTDTNSFLTQAKPCSVNNAVANETTQAVSNKVDAYGRLFHPDRQTSMSPPRSLNSLCSTLFPKTTFLTPETPTLIADKQPPPLLNITGQTVFSSSALPALCRYDFPCEKNVHGSRKEMSFSRGEDYNDKEGLSQYLCGDESSAKGDLPCPLIHSDSVSNDSNPAVVNRNGNTRRLSSVSSTISNTSKISNTNQSFTDHCLATLPSARRDSSRSNLSSDFQSSQVCSQASQEKRLASPTACEFDLSAANLASHGYMTCGLGQGGNDATGESASVLMDQNSQLQMSASSTSCLYSTNSSGRTRKDEVTVPAGM